MSPAQEIGSTTHAITVRALALHRRELLFAILLAFLALGTLSLLSVAPATAGEPGVRQAGQGVPALALDPFASGFSLPVGIVSAGDDRLFVVEKAMTDSSVNQGWFLVEDCG